VRSDRRAAGELFGDVGKKETLTWIWLVRKRKLSITTSSRRVQRTRDSPSIRQRGYKPLNSFSPSEHGA